MLLTPVYDLFSLPLICLSPTHTVKTPYVSDKTLNLTVTRHSSHTVREGTSIAHYRGSNPHCAAESRLRPPIAAISDRRQVKIKRNADILV
jgi:hypothetical protein